jgi:pimeloyl-ACP methyl ester carboxylesterase
MSDTPIFHVEISELRVAVARLGRPGTEPLVFLHGLGASATHDLRPAAAHPRLAARERLLIDLPGFGHSSAPSDWPATIEAHAAVVTAVLDHLEIGSLDLVGHSMGGDIAILVAASAPKRVRRLIVAEPLLDPTQANLSAHIARQGEASYVRRGHRALLMATRRQAARGDAAAAGVLPSFEVADPALMHRSAVSLLRERRPGFGDLLAALPMTRTFIAGERSEIQLGNRGLSDIAVRLISNAGHSMMHEQLDAFVAAIIGDEEA